jgi:hypothetical protein
VLSCHVSPCEKSRCTPVASPIAFAATMKPDAVQYCREVLEQGRSATASELHFALGDLLDPAVIDLFISNAAGNCTAALRGLMALLDLDLSAEHAEDAAPQLSSAANTQNIASTKRIAEHSKAFDGTAAATPRERQALTKQAVAAMQGSFESHDFAQQAASTAAAPAVAAPQLPVPATAQPAPAAAAAAAPRAAPADMFASFIMQYASSQNSNSNSSSSSSTAQQQPAAKQPAAVSAPFATPVQLPAGVQGPSSERQHTIILKTAEKVAAQPGFEVYLNAQSSRAPVMAFMAKDHPLHPYYLGE